MARENEEKEHRAKMSISFKGIWERLAEIADECNLKSSEHFANGSTNDSYRFDGHLFAQRLKEEAGRHE